jgi:hypothetical protein
MLPLFISRRYPLVAQLNTAPSLKRLLASEAGLCCDHAEIPVDVVTDYGDTARLRFLFDTGADLMMIPPYVARHEGIRYREEYPGTLGSSIGGSVRCYFDFVQVRSSISGRTHRRVCAFAESPQARIVLGRSGFLDDFTAALRGGNIIESYPVPLSFYLKHHATRLRARALSGDPWEPI